MKDSPRWLRIYLAITGTLACANLAIIGQIKGNTELSRTAVIFTLFFVTLSVCIGIILFFAAWQAPRLLVKGPKFIRFAILMRLALVLIERVPFAISGDYMSISLLLFWSAVTVYMIKMTDRLADQAKAGA